MSTIDRYKLEGHGIVVFIMCGIPGSGKSTWAQENHSDLELISRDIIRAELGHTSSADEKAVLSADLENKVTAEEYARITKCIKMKRSFIIDDTNTNPKYRKNLLDTLRSYGIYIVGVNVVTPLETCITRRRGQIPEEVIERLYYRQVPLAPTDVDELITYNGATVIVP